MEASDTAGAQGMRASDGEREKVAIFLRDNAAEGRLASEELDERVERAYRAITREQLEALIGDLPGAPLAPPAPAPPAPARPEPPPRAGFWRRTGAWLFDAIVLGLISSVIGGLIGGHGEISLPLWWAYGTLMEGSSRGQTLGKMAFGIRVVDPHTGRSIGFARAFIRQVVALISVICLFLGDLWMLWDGERQCWQDKAAGDVVVPVWADPSHI